MSVDVVRERLTPIPATGRMLEGGAAYVKVSEFTPKVTDEVRADVEASGARARGSWSSISAARPRELSEA